MQSKSHIYGRDCYFAHSGKSKTVTQQKALPGVFARQETAQRKDLQRELEIKFNAAYATAKEELLFTKYRPLLLLHKKNGVNISPTYNNDDKCAEFILTNTHMLKKSRIFVNRISKVRQTTSNWMVRILNEATLVVNI